MCSCGMGSTVHVSPVAARLYAFQAAFNNDWLEDSDCEENNSSLKIHDYSYGIKSLTETLIDQITCFTWATQQQARHYSALSLYVKSTLHLVQQGKSQLGNKKWSKRKRY